MKKREIWIEPVMGMGRQHGYYLWRQTDAGNDEMIGKFQKRKWAIEMQLHLKMLERMNDNFKKSNDG